MKTKIHKILGVALALVLVFGLLGAFIPVNQVEAEGPATTPNQWETVTTPATTVNKIRAADVADIAVASDGKTIYAVDTETDSWAILRSTSAGAMFTVMAGEGGPAFPTDFADQPRLIAVAPDNPNAIAVVDSSPADTNVAAGTFWISNNGGTTWAALTAVPGNAGSTSIVTDIAVGPTRAGTILGRDYVVTVADTGVACDGGDVLYTGFTTSWTSCATAVGITADTYDFTSVAISPGFAGDRCVVAVGSTETADGETYLFIISTKDVSVPELVSPPGIVHLITATTTDSPADLGAAATKGIVASSVALPADFDPTTTAGRRVFLSWTSADAAALGDDVYRVDNTTVRKLQTGSSRGIWSIAYSGTISGGTLIAGENAEEANTYTTLVWHTEDPNVAQPSWATSAKSPTGTDNCVVGIDPADPLKCYAGTSGDESAFSASENGAASFNQRSMIDTTIDTLEDVMLSPDGSEVFLATSCTTTSSLWKSPTPTNAWDWERVRMRSGTTGYIIRLSPEYAADSALYYCDAGGDDIQMSNSGGDIFSTRTAPAEMADVTVENANTVYMISGTNFYKSTNSAWYFGLPVNTGFPLHDIAMAPTYPAKPVAGNLVAGTGIGTAIYSPNAGDSWIPLLPTIAAGGNMQVYADEDYGSNNIVYVASDVEGAGIWRWTIGTSTVWEQIRAVAGQMTGLAQHGGVLYGSWAAVTEEVVAVTITSETIKAVVTTAITEVNNVDEGYTIDYINQDGALATTVENWIPFDAVVDDEVTINLAGTDTGVKDVILVAETVSDATAGVIKIVGTVTGEDYATWDFGGDAYVDLVEPVWPYTVSEVPEAVGYSGVERSLLPRVPAYAAGPFWDTMDVGAATASFSAVPSALRVAGTETETNLWAINTTATLMAYSDEMAKAKPGITVPDTVAFDSVTGGNTEFTISWTNISNALLWNVEIYTDLGCTQKVYVAPATSPPFDYYCPAAPPAPTYVVPAATLVAGADYFVKVRCRDQMPRDAIRSQWSSVEKFSVQAGEKVTVSYLGVQPLGPVPGAIDVPVSPGFTWSPYADSTKYEFQLATDAGFADILAEAQLATTGYKYEGKLGYGTTYFWRARGIEPTVTDWSPVSSFTTEKAPPAPPAPPPAPPTPAAPVVTPAIIWAIIAIGAILVIAVIVLILRTRRVA